MNDRIYQALTAAGLSTSPLGVLDHASTYASAFFALYDTELLYHESGKNSRVPLRDVTRIHSDREGVLRVETSERTAVTASLVGYDPGRVQAFFQQVRDVTARAKELPVLPLNQAKTELPPRQDAGLPGSSVAAAAMPGLSAYTPAATPAPVTLPAAPATPAFSPEPSVPAAAPAASAVASPVPVSPVPVPTPAASTAPVTVTATRRESPRPEPVVISSMPPVSDPPPFQERAGERNRQASSQSSRPVVRIGEPELGLGDTDTGSSGHTQGPLVSVPVSRPLDRQPDASVSAESLGVVTELQRRAEGVQGLARTVSLLAVVLGLAAVVLAFFQWQGNNTLSAIWTLLAGGVGSIALLAFAEALRLLSALARSAQHRQG